jgi:hypothetical protein
MIADGQRLSFGPPCALLAIFVLLLAFPAYAASTTDIETRESENLAIRFERPLSGVADEIVRLYPKTKDKLSALLGWRLTVKPEVVLTKDHEAFAMVAGSDMVIAFTDPRRERIVIDCSHIGKHHFDLEMTFTHELCHLFLHTYIPSGLPRWLDEGIAQWASGGIGEVFVENKTSVLDEAALSGRAFRFDELAASFPENRYGLTLAYEQSRSFVDYIAATFGTPKLLAVLKILKDGGTIDDAVHESMGLPLAELERNWLSRFGTRTAWLVYLSNNLYEILFLLAALLTVVGAVKIIVRRLIASRAKEEEE